MWIVVSLSEQSHIVHPATFLLGNVEPPTKFSKTKGVTESQFLEGVAGKEGVTFARGLQLLHKK